MSTRAWTVMIYFAADNDLSDKAILSLLQLGRIGASEQVHVLAQVDLHQPIANSKSLRYTIGSGPNAPWDEKKIPETNGGAIKDFVNFVEWGCSGEHRAERYLIVIWAHANGIFDNPDHEKFRVSPVVDEWSSVQPAEIGIDLQPGSQRKKFTESGIDITSRDALTTAELGQALAQAQQKLDKKISIFGVDACLMNMVEVAQQIHDSADVMVASQQTIPDTSWPYDKILEKLVSEPTIDERRLAALIVDEYVKAYQPKLAQVTLSACDLMKAEPLTKAIVELRKALAQMLSVKSLRDVLVRARFQVQSFMIQDFVDLYDFCRILLASLKEESLDSVCAASGSVCEEAKGACEAVMKIISEEKSGFVIASGNTSGPGGLLHRARGVSLYFPIIPPIYKNLLFSSQTGWNKFLLTYATALLQDDAAADSLTLAAAGSPSANGQKTTGGKTI